MESKSATWVFDLQLPPRIENPRWKELERAFRPDERARAEHKRLTEGMIWDLNLRPGSRVLEIGAGVGVNAFELASRGVRVVDLDIVPENVELVNYLAAQFGLDVRAVYGDSCSLPFAEGEFDAVFSKSVFEHIHDQERAFDEQIRILKQGGRFMTLDGNLTAPKTLYDMIVRRPKDSKGAQGGIGWLLRKGKAHADYGMGWLGKEEDIKTIWWWKRLIRSRRDFVKPIKITTTRNYYFPDKVIYKILEPLIGMIVVVVEKA
jgi:SAM-dependent methyltransferase